MNLVPWGWSLAWLSPKSSTREATCPRPPGLDTSHNLEVKEAVGWLWFHPGPSPQGRGQPWPRSRF